MKRLIIFCTILAISAMAVVSAQTITAVPTPTKKEQQTITPADKVNPGAEQKTVQAVNDKAQTNSAKVKTLPATQTQDEQSAVKKDAEKQPFNADGALSNERLGEHGPYLYDPDFATKKLEWIKNYPDEYKNSQQQKTTTNPTK